MADAKNAGTSKYIPYIVAGGLAVGAYLLYKNYMSKKADTTALPTGDGAGSLGAGGSDQATKDILQGQADFNQSVADEIYKIEVLGAAAEQQHKIESQLNKLSYATENVPNGTVMAYDTTLDMGKTLQYGQYVPVSPKTMGILFTGRQGTELDPAFLRNENLFVNLAQKSMAAQLPKSQGVQPNVNIKDVVPAQSVMPAIAGSMPGRSSPVFAVAQKVAQPVKAVAKSVSSTMTQKQVLAAFNASKKKQ